MDKRKAFGKVTSEFSQVLEHMAHLRDAMSYAERIPDLDYTERERLENIRGYVIETQGYLNERKRVVDKISQQYCALYDFIDFFEKSKNDLY